MALLVGTVIESARVALPDLPLTLPVPPAPTFTPTVTAGSTFSTGTYFAVATQRNPWGETTGIESAAIQVSAPNNSIAVTNFPLEPGATHSRVYLTAANGDAGSESQYVEFSSPTFTISKPLTRPGIPPSRNTAYNPDNDGYALSAGQAYQWLNEAITRLTRVVGGVLDYSGVSTVAGQPYYVITGEWLDIPNVWYNGWWVQGADPGGFFKRNQVLTAILSRVAVSIFDDRCIFEVSYQPDRTAGRTHLTRDLDRDSMEAQIDDPGAFLLDNGFARIGEEIVAYSRHHRGDELEGLIRRLGGTSQQPWPRGTEVHELNLFFQGRRIMDLGLQPGDALKILHIPAGWTSLLTDYIIAKYRTAEQDYEEQQARLAEFDNACRDWAFNKTVQKHVQVGGTRTPLTFGRTIAGGLIIP